MRALVTGAGGFVGTHLVRCLADDGWEVSAWVRPGSPGPGPGATVVPVDLADRDEVVAAARAAEADVAFLLAASRAATTSQERATTAAVNAFSVQWLVDALPDRCTTVVRLGSSTEYAAVDGPMDEAAPLRPRGFFGATKAAGSLLLGAATGRRTVILRVFQVYGPRDHPSRLVPRALRAARTGKTLPLTGPGQRRDWVYVDDVVEACVRAGDAEHLDPGEVLNIGTGHQFASEEVVRTLERVSGCRIAVAPGAHPGRAWDTGSWVCDPTRARERLGWEAKVTLEDGLRRCWEDGP